MAENLRVVAAVSRASAEARPRISLPADALFKISVGFRSDNLEFFVHNGGRCRGCLQQKETPTSRGAQYPLRTGATSTGQWSDCECRLSSTREPHCVIFRHPQPCACRQCSSRPCSCTPQSCVTQFVKNSNATHTRQCELFAMSEADVEVSNGFQRPSSLSSDGLTSLPCGCKLSCKQGDEDVGWSLFSSAPKWIMWRNLISLFSGLNELIAVPTCSLLEGFWTRANVGCCGASRSTRWLVVHF